MRFVVRRLGFFLVTLWAAVTLNFLIPRLMPGNAAIAMMSRYKGHVNPQAMHALEIAFGIHNHQSLVSSYFTYLGNIARGHFGISLTFFPDTVSHQVLQALPPVAGPAADPTRALRQETARIDAELFDRDARVFEYVDRTRARRMRDEYLAHGGRHGARLWSFVLLEAWLRRTFPA